MLLPSADERLRKKNEVTPCCDVFHFFCVSATVSFSLATGVGCSRDFCSTLEIAFLFQILVFYVLSLDLHVDEMRGCCYQLESVFLLSKLCITAGIAGVVTVLVLWVDWIEGKQLCIALKGCRGDTPSHFML